MNITSLPNLDSDESDSESYSSTSDLSCDVYVIRITPHGKFDFDQIFDFFNKEQEIAKFVIGRETVPREHFHVVCQVDNTVEELYIRGIVRFFLAPFWVDAKGKLPHGFGNKQYNLQLSEDPDAAVSYAVKQQEFRYVGYSPEYIESRRLASFDKKKPSNFQSEYQKLRDTFMETQMDIREFMKHIFDLKSKYDQNVQLHTLYSAALSIENKRDNTSQIHVDNFLSRQ